LLFRFAAAATSGGNVSEPHNPAALRNVRLSTEGYTRIAGRDRVKKRAKIKMNEADPKDSDPMDSGDVGSPYSNICLLHQFTSHP